MVTLHISTITHNHPSSIAVTQSHSIHTYYHSQSSSINRCHPGSLSIYLLSLTITLKKSPSPRVTLHISTITHNHPSSIAVTQGHSIILTITHNHPEKITLTQGHSTHINYHSQSSIINRCHTGSLDTYLLSLTITQKKSPSPRVTLHISTITHNHPSSAIFL